MWSIVKTANRLSVGLYIVGSIVVWGLLLKIGTYDMLSQRPMMNMESFFEESIKVLDLDA